MFRYLVLAYLVMLLSSTYCSDTIENEILHDEELVFAMVLNRHGERWPDEEEMSLSDQQDLLLNLTELEGPEGLTNVGKRRAYQIGDYYRTRYGANGYQLISNLYRHNEISIRSTDKERTKMTIQVAMAAVYPPEVEQQWNEGLGKVWQPVPYYTTPLKEDYLRYYSNCEKYVSLMTAAKIQSLDEEFAPYMDLIPLLYEKTGRNFTENPLLFESLYDLFLSLDTLGLDKPKWALSHMARLEEAAKQAYSLYFRSKMMKKIGGGVLLNEFIEAADDIISGKAVDKRLRLFSSHDFNLGSLMAVSHVKVDSDIPKYGAVFSLELFRSRSTGAYTVRPIYLRQAGEYAPEVLLIKNCVPCDYLSFKRKTEEYLLPEHDYYSLCNIRTEL